jgi:hypothetical protein
MYVYNAQNYGAALEDKTVDRYDITMELKYDARKCSGYPWRHRELD